MRCDVPFFNQDFIKKYYTHQFNGRELLVVLYDAWNDTKQEDLFLILYTQTWLYLEEVYMRNTEEFYDNDIWEKSLFFELLQYGEKHLSENIKYLLLVGYTYSTTEYFFWGSSIFSNEMIKEKGDNILSDLYLKYPHDFMIGCFYKFDFRYKVLSLCCKKKMYKKICELFPSEEEIDTYFREAFD